MTVKLPRAADQNEAVARINKIIRQVKKVIVVLTEKISALREYRVRLVADTVIGKIDVRGIEIPEYEFAEEKADSDANDEEETEGQENFFDE